MAFLDSGSTTLYCEHLLRVHGQNCTCSLQGRPPVVTENDWTTEKEADVGGGGEGGGEHLEMRETGKRALVPPCGLHKSFRYATSTTAVSSLGFW